MRLTALRVPAALLATSLAGMVATGCGSSSSSGVSSGNASTSGAGGGAAAGSDYCTAARVVSGDETAVTSLPATTTIDQIKTAIAKITSDVDAVASVAPSAVSADWNTVKTLFDAGNASVQAAPDLQTAAQALAKFSTTEERAAGARIDTFTQAACGFTITTSPAASSSSSTTS